jgi:prenylcysteine oxidase/farnesylcysteine lyase
MTNKSRRFARTNSITTTTTTTTSRLLLAILLLLITKQQQQQLFVHAQRIAVIGGGISGSFVTKYLMDYDQRTSSSSSSSSSSSCMINVTLFEPLLLEGPLILSHIPDYDDDNQNEQQQFSRVQSIQLDDGTIIELGASIAYKEFHYILDMMRDDPTLKMARAFSTGLADDDKEDDHDRDDANNKRDGMGIYNGHGDWKLLLTQDYTTGWRKKVYMVWRYGGWDLYRVSKACQESIAKFGNIPQLLASLAPDTFFTSPDAIWRKIGLHNDAIHHSFHHLLDTIGVSREISYFRKLFLPYQGNLREELLDAINLVNYNQDNAQVNGMVGMGSFAASSGGLFSIEGGNSKLVGSALRQAKQVRLENCPNHSASSSIIQHEAKRVTTVVGRLDNGFELFTDDASLGFYDIVILAAPLHSARIDFYVQSHFDAAALLPMPFGDRIDPETSDDHNGEGHAMLPSGLPEYALRPYTQVTTTVISNGNLSGALFNLTDAEMPRAIMFTKKGKNSFHNITAITQIKSSTGVYKVFSNEKLDDAVLTTLFGPHKKVEYVKLWGGPYGGATPQYRGDGNALPFLLYDGAINLEGHTTAGALYYPSTMEQSSLACMELSAIGAKAVAKLIAKRLGLIHEEENDEVKEEL